MKQYQIIKPKNRICLAYFRLGDKCDKKCQWYCKGYDCPAGTDQWLIDQTKLLIEMDIKIAAVDEFLKEHSLKRRISKVYLKFIWLFKRPYRSWKMKKEMKKFNN